MEHDEELIIANPFYVISIQDYMFREHELAAAKEDWVLLNAKVIEDTGASDWLNELLDVLTQPPAEYDGHDAANPTLAVHISKRLSGKHEPLVPRELWVQVNTKAIGEMGAAKWLWRLLEVLETGGSES